LHRAFAKSASVELDCRRDAARSVGVVEEFERDLPDARSGRWTNGGESDDADIIEATACGDET
jgi:hypothetical protein